MPIESVVRALTEIQGGPELQEVFKALAVRKAEALPLVRKRLLDGDWYEQHMLTKLLRYSPWPETFNELANLAETKNAHFLARQGALYALGTLGNKAAGPYVVSVLVDPDTPISVKAVAVSALARMGYREAAEAIRPFASADDVQMKVFANRALLELGEAADKGFLISAAAHKEYYVREEACGALALVEGNDVPQLLQTAAASDANEAVRLAALEALCRRELQGRTPREKCQVLKNKLEKADRRVGIWILQTLLHDCGPDGLACVKTLARGNSSLAERAGAFLVWEVR